MNLVLLWPKKEYLNTRDQWTYLEVLEQVMNIFTKLLFRRLIYTPSLIRCCLSFLREWDWQASCFYILRMPWKVPLNKNYVQDTFLVIGKLSNYFIKNSLRLLTPDIISQYSLLNICVGFYNIFLKASHACKLDSSFYFLHLPSAFPGPRKASLDLASSEKQKSFFVPRKKPLRGPWLRWNPIMGWNYHSYKILWLPGRQSCCNWSWMPRIKLRITSNWWILKTDWNRR